MRLSEKDIFKLTVFIPLISIGILTAVLTFTVVSYFQDYFEKEFQNEKREYIQTQKELIKNEVEKVFDLVVYKNNISLLRLQNRIQSKMDSYEKIVQSIYHQNKEQKTKKEIISIIKKTLRDVRLGDKEGYLNIFNIDGIAILLPIQEHYEDMSIIGFRDKRNSFYIQEAIKIAKESSKGYFSNYEVKPDTNQNEEFYKLNFIKYFKPLDIVLSVGGFLDTVELETKDEVIKRASDIRFGKKGYIYIVNSKGKMLAHRDKNLIGTDAFKIKDINGKYYFKEGFYKAKKYKEAFIEYVSITNKDNKSMYNAKKLSFAKYDKENQWVISAGVYIDDIEYEIEAKKAESKHKFKTFTAYIVLISIILSVFVLLISLALASSIKKIFIKYKKTVSAKEEELYKINISLKDTIKEELEKSRKKDMQLLSQARFASLGEMIGNIAHQWRQPLSAISTISSGNIVQSQLGLLSNDENTKSYEKILGHVKFLSQTIDDFRNYLSKNDDQNKQFDIKSTLNDILKIIEVAYKDNDIKLVTDITDKETDVFGSSSQLAQVILNILNNAKDALVQREIEHKTVKVELFRIQDKKILKIYDNAHGIPKNIIEKIFDPYFTTKHQSQGTGIGLYMSKDIIQTKFNGKLEVENVDWSYNNEIFEGACFIIEI